MDDLGEISKEKERWYSRCIDSSRIKPAKTSWGSDLDVIYTPIIWPARII